MQGRPSQGGESGPHVAAGTPTHLPASLLDCSAHRRVRARAHTHIKQYYLLFISHCPL